ncbi:relaxase/mobilization nuclease domain-containing protein [Sphingobacterium multivorum]|uniref:relaxase/mobilization nuclease domain-containing protein n=1 Tax=Sphingobacterium multivorum TaxID=28454 RepID=UPI0028AB5AE8|nr:relaxase/mobilization nuclease domain-containing protein [Sphingobacterium multivorum]
MVAIITTGYSIRRTFLYNENKVTEGVAECLMAANFPMELPDMTQGQRLNMLLKTADLNPDVKRNNVHITLNFAPGESFSEEKLCAIAGEYMERIGFGEQPYLVYKHNDAGHPHIHIATVKIRPDGSKIDMQNIGKLLSQPARIELEQKYGLVKAEDHKKDLVSIKPVDARKVMYGKIDTKRAIGNVLAEVLGKFKFTSLPELNAVLNLYNVHAERGAEGSRIYRHNGLQYRVLDADGDPVGTPIKASLFHDRPTLKNLEKLYVRNDVARQQYKKRLQTNISFILKSKQPGSLQKLKELLHKEDIRLIPRLSKEGIIHGITYVDLKTKCVFNGSALGKKYSAKAILESIHLKTGSVNTGAIISAQKPTSTIPKSITRPENSVGHNTPQQDYTNEKSIMELLTQYEFAASSVPYEWRKKKRKRKRRIS